MDYGATLETITARARILGAELRLLAIRSDLQGSADTTHALRNHIMTAQGALGLANVYGTQGRQGDAETLIELTETRMREIRRLLFGTRRAQIMRQRWATQTALA